MSEVITLEDSLIKLKDNKFDLTTLTPDELEIVKKYAPVYVDAANKLVHESGKLQEKVLNTIDRAMEMFNDQLKKPDLTPEERKDLNDRIERMVEQSLKESSQWKKYTLYAIAVLTGGAALYLGNKNRPE